MKLLMMTRKVDREDSSPAGFTYNWVKKIGEKLEKLYVITWQKSDGGNLPENIKIISLLDNRFFKIFALQFKLLKVLSKVDGIFCHQNPEYTILSAFLAKIFRKKIISWYTHKAVNWKLHLVNLLTNKILTASEESCRLKNRKKIKVIGHGIDIEKFKKILNNKNKEKFNIVSIGRISPSKDYETLIKAIEILIKKRDIKNLEIQIIGGSVFKKEQKYFENLKQIIKDKKLSEYIKLLGPVPHNQILSYYQDCDLFVNMSQTGSVDKAILEAMACETLVLTSNEAFVSRINMRYSEFVNDELCECYPFDIESNFGIIEIEGFMFKSKDFQDLANKIVYLMNLPTEIRKEIGLIFRNIVIKNYNLDKLVKKILACYEE